MEENSICKNQLNLCNNCGYFKRLDELWYVEKVGIHQAGWNIHTNASRYQVDELHSEFGRVKKKLEISSRREGKRERESW